jgi:hypothetical protein
MNTNTKQQEIPTHVLSDIAAEQKRRFVQPHRKVKETQRSQQQPNLWKSQIDAESEQSLRNPTTPKAGTERNGSEAAKIEQKIRS